MKPHICLSLKIATFMLFSAAFAHAQEAPSLAVGTGRSELRIKIDLAAAIPAAEVQKLKQIGNYEVVEKVNADALAAQVANDVDRINAIVDPEAKKTELDNLAARLRSPQTNLVNLASSPSCLLDCTRITLPLTGQVDYDKTYTLKITGVVLSGQPLKPVDFKIEKSAAIIEALNASNTRKELRIKATGPLDSQPPAALVIQSKTLRINADGTRVLDHLKNISATVTQPGNNPNLLEVHLSEKLNEAQSHTLATPANALTDGTGVPIAAKGTIKIPGLASAPDDPTLSLAVATNSAVHQKPQFDLDVTWAPYKKYRLKSPGWFLHPETKVDVGLGETKSDNAITLALLGLFSSNPSNLARLPLVQPALQDGNNAPVGTQDEPQLKTYRRWKLTPWYQLGSYDFFVGPKMEADRVFRRINVLGSIRIDFRFHRWVATISEKRKLLTPNLGELADLVEINRGFRVIPYVSFDFGAHVKNETIENTEKKVSTVVPRHPIFRSNLGLKAMFQWRMFSLPMTLTFDERAMHLASREEIGYVSDDGVGLRRLRGFHHRGEAAWNIALDPAKHYNFTFTYENGRAAPNFEYLNKLSTGFKIVF